MRPIWSFIVVLTICTGRTWAGEPVAVPTRVSGKLSVGSHRFTLQSGEIYRIRAVGQGFRPNLLTPLRELRQIPAAADPAQPFAYETLVCPSATKEYRLFVTAQLNERTPDGPLSYELTVQPVPLSKTPTARIDDLLRLTDPVHAASKGVHRGYPVMLKAGRVYVIDMVRKDKGMDPLLYLEDDGETDAARRIVAEDDDSAGDVNARIVFQPQRDGPYRIIATTLGRSTGAFLITVRSTP